MFLSQVPVLLDEGVDPVYHLLDQLHLGVSQPVLVGDVVGNACLTTRLSSGSSGLKVVFFAPLLQTLQSLLGPSRQINMDRCSHSCPEVGGTGMNVTILRVQHEVLSRLRLDGVADSLDAPGEPVEHSPHVSTTLHGDDPQLVLLVDPGQEGLVLVVEDSSSLRPVSLHTSSDQVAITGDEEEMIVNELLPDLLSHPSKRKVSTSQISSQVGESFLHQVFHSKPLFLGDAWRQSKTVNASSNSDTGGMDRSRSVNIPLDLGDVHVAGVLAVGGDAMVLLDDGVEHVREDLVRVPVSSIDTAVLVIKLHRTGDGLGESEAAGGRDGPAEFVPERFGHILGHQGVSGLDLREWIRHFIDYSLLEMW